MTTFGARKVQATLLESAYEDVQNELLNMVRWDDRYQSESYTEHRNELLELDTFDAFMRVVPHLSKEGYAVWEIANDICTKLTKI